MFLSNELQWKLLVSQKFLFVVILFQKWKLKWLLYIYRDFLIIKNV